MKYLRAFKTDIVNLVWKTNEREAESVVLLIFVHWRCLNLRCGRSGGVEQKALFRASWNRIFFQLVFFTFDLMLNTALILSNYILLRIEAVVRIHSFFWIWSSNILPSVNVLIFSINLSFKYSYSCSYSFMF